MILDALLKLSANQQVTADAASTNTIDFGDVTPKRQVAVGEPMALVVACKAKGTHTGTVKLTAVQSAAADLSSPQIIGELDLLAAQVIAGKTYVIPLAQGTPGLRYFGAHYDIDGTVDFTVDAYLQPLSMASQEKPAAYADAITIS
jgi:hypothetical protein